MGGPIKIGSVTIDAIGQLKVGSLNVQAAYAGSVLIFPATTTTTSTTSTTTTLAPTTTTSTTTTTTLAPTTTTSTTSTTTLAPTTTTSTTSTTTLAPTTTTSTTTSTTTGTLLLYSYTLYYDYNDGPANVIGVNSGVLACDLTNNLTVYSNSSTFSAGTTLYYDAYGTIPIYAVPYIYAQNYFKYNENYVTFETDGFTVRTVTACATTTTSTTSTTTTVPFSCLDCRNWQYLGESIPVEGDVITYYSCANGSTQTIALSYGDPSAFFCSCNTIGNPTSANGTTLTEIGICAPETTSTTTSTTTIPPTTTSTTTTTTTLAPSEVTIFWDVREVGSGAVRLVIYDSTSAPIVDEESQGSGPLNGSITTSNTPFTVAVSRAAGSEVAQYRICNDSVGVEITHDYSVTSEVTYVVDPTPLTTSIFATYGNSNTPIGCSAP